MFIDYLLLERSVTHHSCLSEADEVQLHTSTLISWSNVY